MSDGEQKVATAVRKVFSIADIPTLGHTVAKRWVRVPEWGDAEVCMWGTTLDDRARIESDAAFAEKDEIQAAIRRQISAIIACARDGDTPDAKRLFAPEKHWAWLQAQPSSVLNPLYAAVLDLDISGAATQEVEDLFGIAGLKAEVAALRNCLSYIASASASCTDCPENSQGTCQLRPSMPPSPPTES